MKKSTLVLLISTALFFTSTLVLLYLNYLKPNSTYTPNTGIVPPTTISPDPVANWETYNSPEFGFSIDYPQNLQVQDYLNNQYNRTVSFKGTDLYFSVTLRKADSNFNLDKYYFMDNPIARTTTLSGQKANIYEMPNGYCDGPGCSEPYIAIVTEHNGDVYSISFFGDSKLSSLESQILSTFKFNNQNNNLGNWIKRANGDFQTSSGCLWLMTTKANDSGSLDQYVKNYFKTDSLDPFINSQKYQVKNHETITISPQGVGELFTVFFPEDTKKYSISFNVTNQDNILETVQCQNYQKDINFVLNNPENFVNN